MTKIGVFACSTCGWVTASPMPTMWNPEWPTCCEEPTVLLTTQDEVESTGIVKLCRIGVALSWAGALLLAMTT